MGFFFFRSLEAARSFLAALGFLYTMGSKHRGMGNQPTTPVLNVPCRRGLNVEQSAMLGNAAGAATCTRSGAGENVADLRKIISVLESGANKVNRSAEACRDLLNAPSLGLRNRCRDERGEEEQ